MGPGGVVWGKNRVQKSCETVLLNALDCSGKSFYLKASWDTHVLQVVWKKLPQGAFHIQYIKLH